jgi:moderate conductance mechanosensitive channel
MPVEAAVAASDVSTLWLVAAAIVGAGWVLIALASALILLISRLLTRRIERLGGAVAGESGRLLHDLLRKVVVTAALLAALAITGLVGWLAWQGTDPWVWGVKKLSEISPEVWIELGFAIGKLVLVAVALVAVVRVVRRLLQRLSQQINAWDGLADNDRSLERFFSGLDRALVVSAWLGFAAIACVLINLPEWCGRGLASLTRIYAIIAIGLLVLRATAVVVDTCEGLSRRYAEKRDWAKYYDHLRPLVPLLRRCLEYAMWIAMASLVLHEVPPTAGFAHYGPGLMQAIGVFFVGRVVIEVGNLLIGRNLLDREGLNDLERRRRETIVPLARSIFRVACYFAIAILILDALSIDTTPFLAGAGILSMVIGLGAQAMINDVVSGFFILFENVYLVGDVIEGGGAKGTVESIEFRTTRIRDADGRLHILRNGDMKQVVNYSKEFIRAVVPFDVGYDADLQQVFRTIHACGERLRSENADVLAAVEIDGITGFSGSALTIRTSIKVRPGRHDAVANQWRMVLKEAFDAAAVPGTARKGLVPELRPA